MASTDPTPGARAAGQHEQETTEGEQPMVSAPSVRPLTCLARGLTLGCGVCGRRRGLFRRWVIMAEDCPRCGLHFERTEGHFVGAVGMNTILSFCVLFVALMTFVAVTYPDIPAGPWVFAILPALALVPIVFYPVSKTFWTSVDLLMRPLEPGEVLPREVWRR